jgi:hypothetical protein
VKPFDVIEAIGNTKQDLMRESPEECAKAFNPYLTNRAFSYHPDTVLFANDMNVLCHLDADMQYRVLFDSIRAKKRFSKWHKPTDAERVDALSEWYQINRTRARELLRVLNPEYVDSVMKRLRSCEDEGAGRVRRG